MYRGSWITQDPKEKDKFSFRPYRWSGEIEISRENLQSLRIELNYMAQQGVL
jgi:hypothetical protein